MRATGTFTVKSFVPIEVVPDPAITTALPVGVARLEKQFEGEITGRSATLFTSAFDQVASVGTYVAMESFEGAIDGRAGTFNFVHSASTDGTERTDIYFAIVAGSGTGALTGITGTGDIIVDADGTHRMWLEYELA